MKLPDNVNVKYMQLIERKLELISSLDPADREQLHALQNINTAINALVCGVPGFIQVK